MLSINNHTEEKINQELLEKVYLAAQSVVGLKGGVELSIGSEQEIQGLNKKYAQNDYPTDVLSWAYTESSTIFEHELIGEVFISFETAKKQALTKQHDLDYELAWLLAHGLLHIIGYDHQDEETRKEMDALTVQIVEAASE